MFGAHNNIEMLHAMYNTKNFNPSSLKLTPRGTEVFRLFLEGLNDKRIGERLSISYSGVRRHKEKMLLANGCGTMLELAAKYYAECEPATAEFTATGVSRDNETECSDEENHKHGKELNRTRHSC